ncbi:MAG: class I SAM-dependent methyltransferase [Devosia sp.]|nr:class I SAM-dependent methyltransferase [Devosia sp.]
MQSLYDDPELYDLVAPADAAMERFYVEAAGGPGRRVLELACGSGRFTVPLAASGALVIGGDLSQPMLARARAAAAERGVSAEFVTLDMRDFVLGRRFDAIVIAANSDPISQVMRTDWYWSTAEHNDFRHTPLELRQIFPQELPLLLEAGGLRLLERFGDFDRGPLTAASHRQVCVCAAMV